MYLNESIINDVEKTKYLRYMYTNDKQDNVEMLRQLRLLYMRSSKILLMVHFCTIDDKLKLFRSFVRRFTAAIYGQGAKIVFKQNTCNFQ